jgi:ABC-2 type transport system permease protein
MSPWRLEVLRLWRTRRLVALVAPFVLLGFGIPILTNRLPELAKHTSGGVRMIAPPPTPADALAGFAANVAQLGTVVIVVVAAASLTIDAHPALAAFYRSRVRRASLLVVPRYLAVSLAATLALGLGILCAWYATSALIGPLRPGALATGYGLEALWVWFCVAVVAAWSSVARDLPAVAGASLASILALVFLGSIHALSSWSPSALALSVAERVRPQHAGVAWHAFAITAAGTAVLVTISTRRLARRSR